MKGALVFPGIDDVRALGGSTVPLSLFWPRRIWTQSDFVRLQRITPAIERQGVSALLDHYTIGNRARRESLPSGVKRRRETQHRDH